MTEATLKMNSPRRARGFTLIELLTTVTIVGILAAIALPSFRTFVAGQRIKNASFDLMSMINLTRSEAIKRNNDVTLNLGTATNPFRITAFGVAAPIRTQEMFAGITLDCVDTAAHSVVSCPATGIIYNGNGRLASIIPALQISSTDNSNPNTRCISIDLGGRPNSKKGSC